MHRSSLFFCVFSRFGPGCIPITALERRFETSILAAADGHVPHDVRSLFSRPPCAAFPGDLPLRTWTGLFLGSSRTSCMPGAPPAAPKRACGVTSREVSRCYVAPPHPHVIARGRPRGHACAAGLTSFTHDSLSCSQNPILRSISRE